MDSGDPWNPRPATVTKVMKMLEGIHRVLKPDGVYISISFGQVILIKLTICYLDHQSNFFLLRLLSCSHISGALYLRLHSLPGL